MFFSPSQNNISPLPFEIHNNFPYTETFWSGNIIREELSYFEDIYSYSGWILINKDENISQIDVTDTILFSSLRNIWSSYEFSAPNYKITQQWIWDVYIDSQSQKNKVFVFAVNTPITVSLVSDDGSEVYTDIFLTPHMYLEFQPLRWKFLKNADRVRIDTIFNLGYIWQRLTDTIDDSNFSRYISGKQSLFFTAYENILSRQVVAQEMLNEFGEKSVIKIPWLAMAQRYINLFMNEQKQIIFYKNSILQGYIDVIHDKTATTEKLSELKRDISRLQQLDAEQYDKSKDIYYELLSLLSLSRDINAIEVKDIFYGIGNKAIIPLDPYFLYSYSLFSIYDDGWDMSAVFFRNLVTLFWNFAAGKEKAKIYEEYFAYFLEKSLMYELELDEEDKDFTKIVEIFSAFNQVASRVYNSNVEQKITGVFIYSQLLQKIQDSMRVNFFLPERNSEKLLIVNDATRFSIEMVQKLRISTNIALSFFTTNKRYLDDDIIRDANIISSIEQSSELFAEYFIALENYEEYVSSYDISKRNALDLWSAWDAWLVLSQENILNYLQKFVGISYEGSSIEIIPNGYEIQNLNISWKRFSFKLYPESGNRMTDIIIDTVPQSYEYKLNSKEDIWSERFKTAPEEEKILYDFSRFFLITFFDNNSGSQVDIYTWTTTSSSEDKTEVVFKRDILLWDNGEFKDTRDTLRIEYADISLVKNDTLYDVYITDSELFFQSPKLGASEIEKNYNWNFSTQYILNSDINNRYFTKFESTIYENLNEKKSYLFGWIRISFSWRIKKEDIRDMFYNFSLQIESFKNLYNTISTFANISNISLQYSSNTQKMTYKFEKNGKSYTILFGENQVEQILDGVTKLLSAPISPESLSDYID